MYENWLETAVTCSMHEVIETISIYNRPSGSVTVLVHTSATVNMVMLKIKEAFLYSITAFISADTGQCKNDYSQFIFLMCA
jgi:hypothetical protein